MKKTNKEELPSVETVKLWVRKDLESAHYCLGLVLQHYPEVVNQMACELHEHIMRKENGSAIDHVAEKRVEIETPGYAD